MKARLTIAALLALTGVIIYLAGQVERQQRELEAQRKLDYVRDMNNNPDLIGLTYDEYKALMEYREWRNKK